MNTLLSTLNAKIQSICEPSPKSFPDPFTRKFVWNRNIMNFWICFCFNILYIIFAFFSQNSLSIDIVNIISNFLVLSGFLILCRSHLWLFNLLYAILLNISGYPLLDNVPDAAYFYVGYIFVLTPFVLILTGDLRLASCTGIAQLFICKTKLKERLIMIIAQENPEIFVNKFMNITLFLYATMLFANLGLLRTSDTRAVELSRAKTATETALEQQKTFIFSFSHELRNPINSLLGNLQLVLQGETLTPKATEMINVAKVCGQILLHGINNVLDTGKRDIGKLEINSVATQVHELFQRTWGIYSELLKQKRLASQLKIERNIPAVVKIDSHKVNQILLNLIGNSIKFTEQGSISVTIKWLKGCGKVNDQCFEPLPYDDIDEGLFEKEENLSTVNTRSNRFSCCDAESVLKSSFLMLSNDKRRFNHDDVYYPSEEMKGVLKIIVKDTGSGMKREALDKLFQKFSQVSENVSQRQIGTGLGLFITKEICDAMDGEIRAYSRLGTGTTFVVCLPAVALPLDTNSGVQRANSKEKIARLTEKKLKALVADDSPFNVNLISDYLSKFGASVVSEAYNGYDAFMKYRDRIKAGINIDVVTLDIDMPIMDGKAACDKIRQYEKENKLKSVIIILISGNYDKEQIGDYLEGRTRKADCFLKKPVSFEDFNNAVYNLIMKNESQRIH